MVSKNSRIKPHEDLQKREKNTKVRERKPPYEPPYKDLKKRKKLYKVRENIPPYKPSIFTGP